MSEMAYTAPAPAGRDEAPLSRADFERFTGRYEDLLRQLEDRLEFVLQPSSETANAVPREAPRSSLHERVLNVQYLNDRLQYIIDRIDL